MNINKPLVIAIAAVSGGGKTTITTHLNKILPRSKVLFFDDYEFDGPDYILLDYPFAYIHSGMCEYIDFTIFIDTPLDIAVARRILRDFKETSIDHAQNDLNIYLSRGRVAYLEMLNTIKPNCDLIIDGSLPIDVIVNQICIGLVLKSLYLAKNSKSL